MDDRIQIRTVKVELLRTGPSHNQLLSPLTPYLGVCDGAEAGIVHVPFEHESFLRRLEALRDTGAEAKVRGPVLRELGQDIACMLGAVPRLPGSLSGDVAGPDTLVHMRLVLSASELALLPFEMSKVPLGPNNAAESWLSLQARVPVVVTRRTRDTSSARVLWPWAPRVLFVASDPEQDAIPFETHKDLLLQAVRPYLKADQRTAKVSMGGRREQYGEALTVLRNASFDDVANECGLHRYTHVHLLAHGGVDDNVNEKSYGLVLHPGPGDDDVVSGERFASAFSSLNDGNIHRPTVVTLATCDSGNAGSVLVPGASMAHALHHAGIPLVVASQFPLSMDGSSLVLSQLYPGLLAGENPLPLLHRIRTELHGRMSTQSHDWASLVVYEALPANATLEHQLEEVRYRQSMRAVHVAFDLLDREMLAHDDRLPAAKHNELVADVRARTSRLPISGAFRLECLGLRGGSSKRLADAAFWAAQAAPTEDEERYADHMDDCCAHLEDALRDYEEATVGFLRNQGSRVRQAASMHWVMVQQLSIAAALGKPVPEGTWEAAQACAKAYIEHGDAGDRGWALGSLIELWLLKCTDPALVQAMADTPESTKDIIGYCGDQALQHARSLVALARSRDDPQVESTRQQVQRYIEWWSHPNFESAAAVWGGTRSDDPQRSWEHMGVTALARELDKILSMSGARHAVGGTVGGTAAAAVVEPKSGAKTATKTTAKAAPKSAAKSGATAAKLQKTSAADSVHAVAPAVASASVSAPAVAGRFLSAESHAATARAAGAAHLSVEMLPAAHGDCLWIEYGHGPQVHRVLVDCGTDTVYRAALKPRLQALPQAERAFELFILSHIDDDHIGGGIELLKDAQTLGLRFGDVWFNGWKQLKPFGFLGAVQGEKFTELLVKGGLPWNLTPPGGTVVLPNSGDLPHITLPGGMVLTLLSPDEARLRKLAPKWRKEVAKLGKEPGSGTFLAAERGRSTDSTDVPALADAVFNADKAEANGSSICVLVEFAGKSVLLGADGHAPVLCAALDRLLAARGLQRLPLSGFKLPHHGSQNNLSKELLQRVQCSNYLVSTSGSIFKHPDREAIGRVIHYGGPNAKLWFNYETAFNRVWQDPALQSRYGYGAVYPQAGQAGLRVTF